MSWRAPGFSWLLMGMCLASASVGAQSSGAEGTDSEAKTKSPAADETSVSMEFLEFLGTWETSDGEWVDPTEVQSADWPVISDDSADRGADDAN